MSLEQTEISETEKYNRRLLLTDGVLYYASRSLFDYNVLVPAFISHLGASSFLVGLAVSMNRLGFFLPQIFVANYAAVRPLNKPILLLGARIYTYSLAAMVPLMLILSTRAPLAALALFFLLYSISCAGDGVQALPWVDILAKSIHGTRRGRLVGYMQALGGIAAFGMAALVAWILTRAWLAFPINYILLVLLAALVSFGSLKVLSLLVEPAKNTSEIRQPLKEYLRSIPNMVRANPGFKRFLLVRCLSQSYSLAAPFYVTYAIDVLGAPKGIMGGFIAAQMAGLIVGGIFLGYMGDMVGNSWSVRLAITASLAAPAVGLSMAYGPPGTSFSGPVILFFLILYFFLGTSLAGLWMAMQNYLLDLVDPNSRPTCVGLTNMLVAPVSFLPMLGGIIVVLAGYRGLFAITMLLILAALWFSLGMREPRKRCDDPYPCGREPFLPLRKITLFKLKGTETRGIPAEKKIRKN